MGLCKCPKKKVTNQFCFEHRVNVCEHCMVSNHPKCIIQSYLQWLQDSEYDPNCELCNNHLSAEDCVRLICYHVFHWGCLDQYARQYPGNTAPAGFKCPSSSCHSCIFPPNNMVSPVAEKLRSALTTVNWARAGLGLPLIKETSEKLELARGDADGASWPPPALAEGEENRAKSYVGDGHEAQPSPARTRGLVTASAATGYASSRGGKTQNLEWSAGNAASDSPASPHTHSVVDMISENHGTHPVAAFYDPGPFPAKRLFDTTDSQHPGNASFDHDENKYRRRPACAWFAQWLKSMSGSANTYRRDPHRRVKRYLVIGVLISFALLTLVMVMLRYGRASADDDPFLNPMANPNIRVAPDDEN